MVGGLHTTRKRLCEVAASLHLLWEINVQISTKLSAGLLPPLRQTFTLRHEKKYYLSQKKSGSELCAKQDLWSMSGISLPAFPFEFSVEQASNRMIDFGSNKGFKADSTFIYCFTFHLQRYEKI